jgi:tRNA-intron endonuclease
LINAGTISEISAGYANWHFSGLCPDVSFPGTAGINKGCLQISLGVKATFDGTRVRLGKDGIALYDQGGYGRKEQGGLRLAPEEALYMLHRGKITLEGYDFDSLLATFTINPDFFRSFLVYRDIRERGYIIQPGPHDFRVFKRGHRPGKGRSQYMVRVISERELIAFTSVVEDVDAASNMRKQFILAVVDDEDELTYYEVKIQDLPKIAPAAACTPVQGTLFGGTVIVSLEPGTGIEDAWFGTRLDKKSLMISPVETVYLLNSGMLEIPGSQVNGDGYARLLGEKDVELNEKVLVYSHLRSLGYIPRTAYKFGHHFRVYSGKKKHSEMLVHAMPSSASMPMSVISRSVRLAHSVRKKMLFACVHQNTIQYIEFSRIKL